MIKKISISIIFLVLLFFTSELFAQSGIKGVVKDKGTGETLIGANIKIDSLENVGASAGLDGDFAFNVQPGTYSVTCTFVGYVPKTISVVVSEGKVSTINFSLDQISIQFEEFKIEEKRITTTENATVADTKESDVAVNIVGQEEIAKSGTLRTASDVAGRIPGVTIIDNRFVMVRGLSERYNAVMINNAFAPSLETDVKTFSFDIIPSQAIERFMIYKSQSPDLPGEFSGGAIKVTTKSLPERSMLSGGYSLGYRNGTTGQLFQSNKGSKTDWLGFDNGSRSLPGNTPENIRDLTDPQQLEALGKSMPNNWSYETKNALPDSRFNLGYDALWSSKDKKKQFGSVTLFNYSKTNQHYISYRNDYNIFDEVTQQSDTIFSYQDTINQEQARVGFLQNFAYRFNDNTIEFRNMFNQIGMNETTIRGGSNFEEGNYRKEYSYRYNQRTFYTGQLSGEHKLGKEKGDSRVGNFDWTVGYSLAKRQDPDWRRVRYSSNIGTTDPYYAYIPFSAQPFYMGRLFIDMKEDIVMGSANYEHRFVFYDKDSVIKPFQPKIKAGIYIENKSRNFGVRNIGYAPSNIFSFNWSMAALPVDSLFLPQNINSTTGLKIDEDTKGTDSYKASNNLRAYYLMVNLPFNKRFKAVGGIRVEDNRQVLNSNRITNDTLIIDNHIISYLPSVNLAYFIIPDTMQIRFGYGKSVNRPEFREIAPFAFYDFIFNSIYQGNDSLKTPVIDNLDVRWEYYPRFGEMISFGGFYKKFVNPIELYFTPGGGSGGTRSFIYNNAPSSVSYGLEFELRKSLKDHVKSKFLSDLTFVLNGAWIHSEIQLAEGATGDEATRPMMGQSPYIINGGIFYQNDSIDFGVSIMFNRIGERVVIVGIPDIPEVYEMPRNRLDITLTKGFGKFIDVRISWQDILNNEFILVQDANGDGKLNKINDQALQSFKRGSYLTFGVNFKLWKDENKEKPIE